MSFLIAITTDSSKSLLVPITQTLFHVNHIVYLPFRAFRDKESDRDL